MTGAVKDHEATSSSFGYTPFFSAPLTKYQPGDELGARIGASGVTANLATDDTTRLLNDTHWLAHMPVSDDVAVRRARRIPTPWARSSARSPIDSSGHATRHTGQAKAIEVAELDHDGIILLRGRGRWRTPIPWDRSRNRPIPPPVGIQTGSRSVARTRAARNDESLRAVR